MPIYNAPLPYIDQAETRRYAGLSRAEDFPAELIAEACGEALLLAQPKGIWELYPYDCRENTVLAEQAFRLRGEKIARHLAGSEKVVLLAATVGEDIEEAVTKKFAAGDYTLSLLLDAAATAAVEQVADAVENAIKPRVRREGYRLKWRFSPGYGDWSLEVQPDMLRLTNAEKIGLRLTESLMLRPRKSITAIIGLYRENAFDQGLPPGCRTCQKPDCLFKG